jgi:hypothetical protein
VTTSSTPAAGDPATSAGSADGGFATPEGLRCLLVRLHESGEGAWQGDREAGELMRYVAAKYRPLARKHGLDVWVVASAAFEAMLNPSVRLAGDPWAVVTRAVQVTCNAETRAAGLLVSTDRARRASNFAGFHDAIRLAERENLADRHPAFQVGPANGQDADDEDGDGAGRVGAAVLNTVALLASLGWEPGLAGDAVAYAAERLGDLGSRSRALEVLRRDRAVPALLGLQPRSWTALLRIVLGRPGPEHAGAPAGDGLLARVLGGETLDALRADPALAAAVRAANPGKNTGR